MGTFKSLESYQGNLGFACWIMFGSCLSLLIRGALADLFRDKIDIFPRPLLFKELLSLAAHSQLLFFAILFFCTEEVSKHQFTWIMCTWMHMNKVTYLFVVLIFVRETIKSTPDFKACFLMDEMSSGSSFNMCSCVPEHSNSNGFNFLTTLSTSIEGS